MTIKGSVRRVILPGWTKAASAVSARRRRREGLQPPIRRSDFLASIDNRGSVLELGPFDRPAMRGPNVAYFDVLDQEGLRQRAKQEGRDPAACPVIDHVSDNGDLSTVPGTFDALFSSHVIEHQHDLVQHLVDAGRLLRPGGSYHVVVPDRRFCFDHFMPESSLQEVLDAADNGPARQVEQAIRHVHYDLTHNDSLRHWLGLHGRRGEGSSRSQAACDADIERYRSGTYRDIHAFRFSPAGFRDIIVALHDLGRSPLRLATVHDTRFAEPEFFAVLTKEA